MLISQMIILHLQQFLLSRHKLLVCCRRWGNRCLPSYRLHHRVSKVVLESFLRGCLPRKGIRRRLHAVGEMGDVAVGVEDEVRPLSPLETDGRVVVKQNLVGKGHRRRVGPTDPVFAKGVTPERFVVVKDGMVRHGLRRGCRHPRIGLRINEWILDAVAVPARKYRTGAVERVRRLEVTR